MITIFRTWHLASHMANTFLAPLASSDTMLWRSKVVFCIWLHRCKCILKRTHEDVLQEQHIHFKMLGREMRWKSTQQSWQSRRMCENIAFKTFFSCPLQPKKWKLKRKYTTYINGCNSKTWRVHQYTIFIWHHYQSPIAYGLQEHLDPKSQETCKNADCTEVDHLTGIFC